MEDILETLEHSCGLEGDADAFFKLAQELESKGDLHRAATAYDRAFGLASTRQDIAQARMHLLNRLSVTEHDIAFRYIPAGTFLMGSENGDPDEQPVHPVQLDHFWMAEVPVSWAAYCDLMDWKPPPDSQPKAEPPFPMAYFTIFADNLIRRQYCENETTGARDWHAHAPELTYHQGDQEITGDKLFGDVPRRNPNRPWHYDLKPMVSISLQAAEDLCTVMSDDRVTFSIPTEAQWEKAARGGLISMPYAWGDTKPNEEICDFDHFGDFFIRPPHELPPNNYGLHGMSGGVWEWTTDWYQSDYFANSPRYNTQGPANGEERVLRGGSWADDAAAVTVSFRISRRSAHWRHKEGEFPRSGHRSPNIGFRICRVTPNI